MAFGLLRFCRSYVLINKRKQKKGVREETFLSVFKTMSHNMRYVVRRFLIDEDDVSDVLQDAFCRLWTRRETISSDEQAKALTAVTVKNLCVDRLRKRHPFVDVGNAERMEADDTGQTLDRKDLYEHVKRIVDSRLTKVQREVFQLKEIDGLSAEEVAAKLSMSVEAVRMNLSRARKTIRECFREQTNI